MDAGERRMLHVEAVAAEDWQPFPEVQQVFWITYRSKPTLEARMQVEKVHYGLTSLPPERASACRLLTLHRGHWAVESRNHFSRDVSLLEDRSQIRTGHGPANNAALNNLALALIKYSAERNDKDKGNAKGKGKTTESASSTTSGIARRRWKCCWGKGLVCLRDGFGGLDGPGIQLREPPDGIPSHTDCIRPAMQLLPKGQRHF